MGNEQPQPQWRAAQWCAIGQSVRGAAHVRGDLPDQDAIRWLPASGLGAPLILAVSDGHGSPRYFRSHVGADLAVETAVWVIQDLLDGQPDPANLTAIKRTAEDRLPREIVRRWQEAVAEHIRQSPLTPDELGTLEGQKGVPAREAVTANPLLAYGSTVLAVLVAETFVLYLQLGDGDILVVSQDGQVTRPIERDERLFANQTTSLCSPDAWRDVQIRFQALVPPSPALILLATDGYANSFVNEAAFVQVGPDILDLVRTTGLEAVETSLATWLTEASQAGSGDDITLGILCRADICRTDLAAPSHASETPAGDSRIIIDTTEDEAEVTVTVRVQRAKKSS
ncbi:MAG: protein phosphatase 2C domain-containing protein [Chloroflexi bacterium]|nr:protein phosphatase 2C domain-containing protein [Chloroflexota bacterium]MBU1746833.1 protein phosphatase 2C domain-containing protein [Chloroflexota bacterium]